MKIIAGRYPELADWQQWITFTKGPGISLVFLYRLAAYVRDSCQSKVSMYGFRTYAEQQAAYANYLAGGNLAAKPGLSWHEYGLAVDFNRIATVDGKPVYKGSITADYNLFMAGKAELTLPKYGLTHTVRGEPWHIQPVETKGFTGVRSAFLDDDDLLNGDDTVLKIGDGPNQSVYDLQTAYLKLGYDLGEWANWKSPTLKDGRDAEYGNTCSTITKQIQLKHGLPQTGSVDDATWGKIGLDLAAINQALLDAEKARTVAAQGQAATYKAELDAAKKKILEQSQEINTVKAADAAKRAELVSVAAAMDTIDAIRAKY